MFPRLPRRFALLCLTLLAACALPQATGAAPRAPGVKARVLDGRVALPGSLGPASLLRRAKPLGRVDASQTVTVALSLPWRNGAALSVLLARQSNPRDLLYKHWLTGAEFDARFAPTLSDYDAVQQWAAASGLRVTHTSPSRSLLLVSGSRDAVEAAFTTRLLSYRMADGRTAMRPDAAPRVPAAIAARIAGVSGLDTLARRRPMLQRVQMRSLQARRPLVFNGNGPAGGLTPADVKTLYNLNGTDVGKGAGQTIALYELDGYDPANITTYATTFGLGTPTLQNVLLDDFNGIPTSGVNSVTDEVTLDIELALALAPKAKIVVYEADNSTPGSLAILQQIATDDTASVVSISYGLAETLVAISERTSENAIFQQMRAQGQGVFASSGDTGSYQQTSATTAGADIYTVAVGDPASQPNVVAVGGTTLLGDTTAVTDPTSGATTYTVSYQGESTWNNFPSGTLPTDASILLYGAGGGGISTVWPKPDYQNGVGASLAGGGTGMRDVPDVALNADPNTGYTVYTSDGRILLDGTAAPASGPGYDIFGGTSASAPLWAAFNALVNERRASYSLERLGFANPDIYSIAEGTGYTTDFHDIADGSNNLTYFAKAGYDDATGWGTFNGGALLARLAPAVSAPFDLHGTVTDASGKAVSDATVTITTPQIATLSVSQTTDGSDGGAAGSYKQTLNSLIQTTSTAAAAAINYTVTVDAPGFAGQTITNVTVPATLNFVLRAPDHVFSNPGTLQMISAPYDYTAAGDFLALFGLSSSQLVSGGPNLIIWAPDLGRYLLYPSAPADTLHIGKGYWARLGTDGTILRSGTPAPSGTAFRINLAAGWNQIGDPFPAAVSVGALQVDSTINGGSPVGIGSSADIVLPLYDYSGGAYQSLSTTGALQPYVGYWIYAKNAVTLVVPPSQ